jgi:hypothetical protein
MVSFAASEIFRQRSIDSLSASLRASSCAISSR